jgi:hypothetical protein
LAVGRLPWPGHEGSFAHGLTRIRWVRGAAFALGLLAADLLIALVIVEPRLHRLLLLGVGVVALALVFRFPMAATCGFLLAVATVIEPNRWKFGFGPLEIRPNEVLLGALLLVALVRPRRAWWGGFAGLALAGFFVVLLVSCYLTIASGRADVSAVYQAARRFAPLLLFFVLVRLFPEPERMRRLLLASVVMAALAGIVALLVAAPGSPLVEVLNPDKSNDIRDKEGLGLVNRVRLPGVGLSYVLFWYAAVRTVHARAAARLWWLAALAALGLSLALSFNRNMWVGLVLGLVCMLAVSRVHARRSYVIALVLLATVGMGAVVAGTNVSADSPVYPIVQRGTTLFNPQAEARDTSLQDRVVETRYAFAALDRHPLTGVGPGAPFGSRATGVDPVSGAVARVDQTFLHNQYIFLLLVGGPLALLTFVAFVVSPMLDVVRSRFSDDGTVALGVGILLTLLSATVSIAFADPTSAAILAVLCGAVVVLTSRSPRPDALPEARP